MNWIEQSREKAVVDLNVHRYETSRSSGTLNDSSSDHILAGMPFAEGWQ
jgi:hypothetical protein